MHYPKRSSTALLASLFVVLVCMAMIALDAWRTWQAHSLKMREASVAVSNMARALAQHADDTFKEADTVLLGLQERLLVDGDSPAALRRLHQVMLTHVKELQQLAGLFVYDQNGRWLVNSQAVLDSSLNNADRPYFIYHRDHPDNRPYVGAPLKSRSSGRWIIPVSRRLSQADGSFAGVVLATIELEYFQRFYNSIDIGNAGAIVLALNEGVMVLRRPLVESGIGKSMTDTVIFRDYASKSDSGLAEIHSFQDGVLRLNAYTHLKSYPLFVSVARAHDEILAEWRTDAHMHMLSVLMLVVGFAVLGRRMVGQIDQRAKAEDDALRAHAQIEKLNQILAQLAMQDGLTGLANRRRFDVALTQELQCASRSGSSLALLMIDVDHFKLYNDMYGHLSGDECLHQVGQAIASAAKRSGDLAARYGGEEFAMILPRCGREQALQIAEQIRQAVRDRRITHAANTDGIVTVSLGVTVWPVIAAGTTAGNLIGAADQALYRAKIEGRDRVGI
jgi:diguanylate cyclase (GGDEF)-like protein